MTKKQKVVFAVVAAVIVLGIIMSYIFLMKNQHIDSIPEEKKMPAMSDTEDYEVRESDESIQSSETEEDYYMTSTGVTAEEQFAEEIKNDVLKHDWDALSEKISYPIAINGTTVNNREDFLKLDIDGKLNQEFVEAIRAETCRKMFCNWQGVMMGDGQIWFDNVYKGTGPWKLSIIGINNMLETESEDLNAEETIEPDPEIADGSVDELSMDELKELLFGEWKVTKLLGFTHVQNDYTNYPEGHDIIGNHIVINEDVFSSEGLEKYERYQCEILEPSYEVSPIKERNLIYYNVKEAIKEDPELYDWILNYGEFQDLEIRGTRDGIKRQPFPFDISSKHLDLLRRGHIALIGRYDLRTRSQLLVKVLQFPVDRFKIFHRVASFAAGYIHNMDIQPAAFHMAQKLMSQANAFAGPFNQARDVRHNKRLSFCHFYHAQNRRQRCKMIVGDFRFRLADH